MIQHNRNLFQYACLIITGGSSGIGYALIRHALNLNPELQVFNLSRSLHADFLQIKGLRHIPCDLSDPAQIEHVANLLNADLSSLSGKVLFINNAGFGAYGPFPSPHLEHQLGLLDVNIRAMVHLTGRLLPLLEKRGGGIINIASTAAFQPTPYLSTYGASKAFVLNWSLSLSVDLRSLGIEVMTVCPGPTESQFFQRAGFDEPPLKSKMGHTSAAVAASVFCDFERGRLLCVPGRLNRLIVFFARRFPLLWVLFLSDRILRRIRNPASSTS
jgi:short-subunit dehydrogenase